VARYRRARHCCLLYLDTSEQLSVSDYWRASTILGSVARGYVCLCVTRNSPFTSSNDHNGPIPVCLLSSYQVLLYYHTKQTRVLASEVANAISPALLQSLTFLPRPIKVLFWLSVFVWLFVTVLSVCYQIFIICGHTLYNHGIILARWQHPATSAGKLCCDEDLMCIPSFL